MEGTEKNDAAPLAAEETRSEDSLRVVFGTAQLMRIGRELPSPGVTRHVLTGGNVDLICFLQWAIQVCGGVGRVFLSCWCISVRDIMILCGWHGRGLLRSVDLVVGDYFPQRYPEAWSLLNEKRGCGVFGSVSSATIHSKVLLVDCGNAKVVVESSANCNMNARVENACVTVSESLYCSFLAYFRKMAFEQEMRSAAREVAKELKKWHAGGS